MKINQNTKLIGRKVILIPYEAKHVEKYHDWMKNPELQRLTASEPLTLEEEYEMQKSWRDDNDKCTFLILSKTLYEETQNEIASLIGDTNLFIEIDENGEKIAEAEIMLAEETCRGQKLGWESMIMMLKYGYQEIGIKKFIAKISEDNEISIKMFQKLKFSEISRSSVFKEVTLEKCISDDWISWIDSQVKYEIEEYHP